MSSRVARKLAGVLRRYGLLEDAFALRRRYRRRRDTTRAEWSGRRARRDTAHLADTHRWVRIGPTFVLCRIAHHMTAADARRRNLEVVLDVLRGAAIDHFFVPVRSADQFRIGVPAGQRGQTRDALTRANLPPETLVVVAGAEHRRPHPAGGTRFDIDRSTAMSAAVWTVTCPVTDPLGRVVFGLRYGTQLEFWEPWSEATDRSGPDVVAVDAAAATAHAGEAPQLRARRYNAVAPTVPTSETARDHVEIDSIEIPTTTEFARSHRGRGRWFPVDAVYTWVDGSDPEWARKRAAALGLAHTFNEDALVASRYANRDELRYSLRSLTQFADFVRHVYLVTDGQIPAWLDTTAPGLTVVDHSEIFSADDLLPTFNSHAIESRLHRIPGLSEHYLYMNDDVFFGRRVTEDTFFFQNGISRYFPSRAQIPPGASAPGEPSVTSAAKNGRYLVWQEFGLHPTQKMKHTPHPQRLSIHGEIERRFPDAVARVGRSQFRQHTDISMASSLHHHVGAALGLAIAGSIRYDYLNLASTNLPDRLHRLTDGSYHAFCLNDVDTPAERRTAVDAEMLSFLNDAFPWPSPWEKPQTGR